MKIVSVECRVLEVTQTHSPIGHRSQGHDIHHSCIDCRVVIVETRVCWSLDFLLLEEKIVLELVESNLADAFDTDL